MAELKILKNRIKERRQRSAQNTQTAPNRIQGFDTRAVDFLAVHHHLERPSTQQQASPDIVARPQTMQAGYAPFPPNTPVSTSDEKEIIDSGVRAIQGFTETLFATTSLA